MTASSDTLPSEALPTADAKAKPHVTTRAVLASVVGTTIEYYDFYVYGIAAAIAIGPTFFPAADRGAQSLAAFLSFGIAFLARPLGSALFGHLGDRKGRKSALVISLLLMGFSTVGIGLLPGYALLGIAAPLLLCLLRFGQGLALGGEWGGAALITVEDAPKDKRGWFGMFCQLGAGFGFLLANGMFLLLALLVSDQQFKDWGWRVPFVASAVLVVVGYYVRARLAETRAFKAVVERHQQVSAPIVELIVHNWRPMVLGAFCIMGPGVLFYVGSVFVLGYGSTTLGIPRQTLLVILCFASLFMAGFTAVSGRLSDRFGRRPVLIFGYGSIVALGFLFPLMLGSGNLILITALLALQMTVMGLTWGPMAALLTEIFPTSVRYTGASVTTNLGTLMGGASAPFLAELLSQHGGLTWVGWYMSAIGLVSVVCVTVLGETSRNEMLR